MKRSFATQSAKRSIHLARRTATLRSNVIRDMLAIASQPDMISLGGGNPARESFPVTEMSQLTTDVMLRHGSTALQYSDTQGFWPLRLALSEWLGQQQIPVAPENLLITSGSQSALDILAKTLIDDHGTVIGEQPTYLGALQAFSLFAPKWRFLAEDADGPLPEDLKRHLTAEDIEAPPTLYVMPAFRNPTGQSWSDERISQIATTLKNDGNWVIEDDPYRLLRYGTSPPPPLKTLLPEQTIYIGTLSKVFAPGLRLGYCAAPDVLMPWLVKAKQGTDLNTGTLTQALAAEYLTSGRLDANLPTILAVYRAKRDALATALYQYLPHDFTFNIPSGGMFLWVSGPPGFDSENFLPFAIREGVFFVPGTAFFDGNGATQCITEHQRAMRLNFSAPEMERLPIAAKRLGKALDAYTKQCFPGVT
ncbi:MAG: PLP-dependent aminotransferase family protein [Deltaproteobacteria bacterium]|nr:PLP-dependent aminotransferase family protein [Deltaproteobacteria bacterium]